MGVAVAPIECLQGKGTEAVSTCACKVMGRACARGSAHLRTKRSSSRRHLRAADVQSGQRSPLCSSARQYGQGRPEHRTGTRTGQVRLYAWRGHRTGTCMEDLRSPARQGRDDVAPEHGWGGPSRPALRCSPQISGTRDGPFRRRQGGQSVANARHGHARQAASFAGDHSQVCRAECVRSPALTQMKMSQPASRAGRTHEDAQMESSTCFHTAPLRAGGDPIVDVRSGGEGGHEGSERAQILLPVKNGDPVKQG